jgi:hypothetical protein
LTIAPSLSPRPSDGVGPTAMEATR